MNRISDTQLFAVLLCVSAFGLISSGVTADASQMAGAAISTLIQLLFAVPIILLYRRRRFSLSDGLIFGRFGKALYVLFFILCGAFAFSSLWSVSKSVYFPVDSSLACSVILAAVCLYCSSLKISALSRASLIIAGILFFSVAVMIIGAYPHADLSNYIPKANAKSVLRSCADYFCSSGELVTLFVLLDSHKGNSKKSVIAFFTGSLLLTELVYIIEITVLGNLISISNFPFFTAGAFSQPFSIQRSDSLYMITFTLVCILTVTLRIMLASALVKQILPDLKYNSLLIVVLMLGFSTLLNATGFDVSIIIGILTVLLAVVLPVIMLIRRTINDKKASHSGDTASDTLRLQSSDGGA